MFLVETAVAIGENQMTTQAVSLGGPLSGRRVLVIEDEYFLADDLVRALSTLGARIVGPFGDLDEATDIVDRDIAIDAAIVDVNLRSQMVFPLARLLRTRNIPFVFTTGYDRSAIDVRMTRTHSKPCAIASTAKKAISQRRG